MLRKISSVVAGYAVWSVLWLCLGSAVQALMPGAFDESGGTRSVGLLLAILVSSVLFSLLAGWLSVVIARGDRRCAVWTGVLLLATGIPVQVGAWELFPAWYHIAFLVLLLPATLLGGALRPRPARTRLAPQV